MVTKMIRLLRSVFIMFRGSLRNTHDARTIEFTRIVLDSSFIDDSLFADVAQNDTTELRDRTMPRSALHRENFAIKITVELHNRRFDRYSSVIDLSFHVTRYYYIQSI